MCRNPTQLNGSFAVRVAERSVHVRDGLNKQKEIVTLNDARVSNGSLRTRTSPAPCGDSPGYCDCSGLAMSGSEACVSE